MIRNTFYCLCHDPTHQLIIDYYPDDKEKELYISVGLRRDYNFFKRLIKGLKYILNIKDDSNHYFFDIMLDEDDQEYLIKVIQNSLDRDQ